MKKQIVWYALVNTMSRSDLTFGVVLSRHRTIEGCLKARRALDREHKRAGGNAYTPTVTVQGPYSALTGIIGQTYDHWVGPEDCQLVDQSTIIEAILRTL